MACSQLSDSDTLASGPAESPVEMRTDLSGKGAMSSSNSPSSPAFQVDGHTDN